MWGQTGWLRMFDADSGGQISWLIPAALLLAGYLLYAARRAKRIDLARADVLLWLSWLLVTMATFSFMAGIFHDYYEVALAPAGGAGRYGCGDRVGAASRPGRLGGPGRRVGGHRLVVRAPAAPQPAQFHAWLAPTVLIGGLLAALALLGNAFLPQAPPGDGAER